MTETGPAIMDVDETTFEPEVVAESRDRPVVVDFWAPWCGPCRVLGPMLERLATEHEGAFRLAKVNADENPGLAADFQVRGIPALRAIRNGRVIDELTGAVPEPALRAWLERFVPGPADALVDEGDEHRRAGRAPQARAAYERALELRPRHARALLALAEVEAEAGEVDAAERHLDMILPDDAEALAKEISALRLQLHAAGSGSLSELVRRVASAPDDLDARVELGKAQAAAGQHEAALATLLEVVKRSPRVGPGEAAREAMLEIFGAIGARSPLADAYREKLAAELYK
ncbi:MAG TPA: tetratricopeptide repeat protein [Vulgatibacter sp.]|nr:tetratricopeptide repeat protein [Vulgatibacter sp.]